MTAHRPPIATLTGGHVTLVPLTEALLPSLFSAIGHPSVFAGGYGGGPAGLRTTVDGFVEWARGYYLVGSGNPYAVLLRGGRHDGLLVGATQLGDFEPVHESAHIGWTAYDPRVWGTAVNAETKLLLLSLAFGNGFGRVKIQADAANERSRAAIAGIGATFEGVLRRDKIRADGTWRDTAVYSVIAEEWPRVLAHLEVRLARFAGRPVEFRDS